MANVVPLAVSGQIQSATQTSIIMAINDNTPYYLVTDNSGNPYFQPLYQDVSTGLEVFTKYATRVTAGIGLKFGNGNSVTIVDSSNKSTFVIDSLANMVVGKDTYPSGSSLIPIKNLTFKDPAIIVCGYQYIVTGGVGFFTATNWSPTPNTQNINSISQGSPTTSFYFFPIEGLVNSSGKPASETVFTVIYNDVLGRTPQTYLFTSFQAWQAGGGLPYYFCPDSSCGPLCYGLCSNSKNYSNCLRLVNGEFGCIVNVSWKCKILAVLPFLIPTVLCMIIAGFIFFRNRYYDTTRGLLRPRYTFSLQAKLSLAFLVTLPAVLLAIMLLLTTLNTNATNRYLRSVCRLTREYQ